MLGVAALVVVIVAGHVGDLAMIYIDQGIIKSRRERLLGKEIGALLRTKTGREGKEEGGEGIAERERWEQRPKDGDMRKYGKRGTGMLGLTRELWAAAAVSSVQSVTASVLD